MWHAGKARPTAVWRSESHRERPGLRRDLPASDRLSRVGRCGREVRIGHAARGSGHYSDQRGGQSQTADGGKDKSGTSFRGSRSTSVVVDRGFRGALHGVPRDMLRLIPAKTRQRFSVGFGRRTTLGVGRALAGDSAEGEQGHERTLSPASMPAVLRVMPAPAVVRVVRPAPARSWAHVSRPDVDHAGRRLVVDRRHSSWCDDAAGSCAAHQESHKKFRCRHGMLSQEDRRGRLLAHPSKLSTGRRPARPYLPIFWLTLFSWRFKVCCSCLVM